MSDDNSIYTFFCLWLEFVLFLVYLIQSGRINLTPYNTMSQVQLNGYMVVLWQVFMLVWFGPSLFKHFTVVAPAEKNVKERKTSGIGMSKLIPIMLLDD